jgi:ABC-2 type transport system permease protein
MIRTVCWIGWLCLRRDKIALLLTFVLPVVFFSIFAAVFSGMSGGDSMSRVDVAVVDEDESAASARYLEALRSEPSLRVRTEARDRPGVPLDRAAAHKLVEDGRTRAAVVLLPGFGARFARFGDDAPAATILADTTADPIAWQVVQGMLQKVAMTAAPDLMIRSGFDQFDRFIGMTDAQRAQLEQWLGTLPTGRESGGGSRGISGIVPAQVEDVRLTTSERQKNVIAFYAAGIGVMFLLFSMVGAAGGFLDEEQNGTLERVLASGAGIGTLLLGNWLFCSVIGAAQVTVMFVWGQAVFGLDLFTPTHLVGFCAMTLVTAAAAAAFGMMLGAACRSRAQLHGLSTIVILVMSALGGSMLPRFLMSPTMQQIGLLTFNGWALDGYRKVFWEDKGVPALWPQLAALAGMALVFLGLARRFARRWETM